MNWQMEDLIKNISPKYKNILNLSMQLFDNAWKSGIQYKEYPIELPSYWVKDYQQLNSLDRLAVLREVVCKDLYKAEQITEYIQYCKDQEPVYRNDFENIMNTHTPELIIPDTISQTEFYTYEEKLCRRNFLFSFMDFDTIRLPIHWDAVSQWYVKHPDSFVINMDPPLGTDYFYFSLEEFKDAIAYGQAYGRNTGTLNIKFKKIRQFLRKIRN